ncbi:hypothetical protein ACIA8K_39595 [Catenuloplanes sp. NPDC051500]|uniref:hypothetical protein n=1 Tax=Catenuloplanes sp. NPDC051500 TaxID=3363959 RepID=UPI0037BB8D92
MSRAEQQRITADANVDRRARESRLALELRQERRAAARRERLERVTERRAGAEQRRMRRRAVLRRMPRLAERALFVLPILFPMAVAWVGQIQFAMQVMGWPLAGAVVFAAGFELSTAYVARLDWRSRAAGDSGMLFRAATWAFAAGAAMMNYWHAAGPNLAPTGEAVSYGLMSVTGVTLWELWSIYRHRTAMRAEGRLPATRPRFGAARWMWFGGMTYLSWLIALRDGHTTTEAAWRAAFGAVQRFGSVRAARKAVRKGADVTGQPDGLRIAPAPSASQPAAASSPDKAIAAPASPAPVEQLALDWSPPPPVAQVPPAVGRPVAPSSPASTVALATQMETFARRQLAAGEKVTGAALDRHFGTNDYGRKVLRRITAEAPAAPGRAASRRRR